MLSVTVSLELFAGSGYILQRERKLESLGAPGVHVSGGFLVLPRHF
jgi:hypothetical protein